MIRGDRRTAVPVRIRTAVWTDIRTGDYTTGEKYHAAVLEQYKLCVEMADRTSARRGLANTYFLTLNTLVVTVAGVFGRTVAGAPAVSLLIPLSVLLLQCVAWFTLLQSYRRLNAAKYLVIGVLEQRLPASPLWAAERPASRHLPLTFLEQWIPATFAAAYVAAFVVVVVG
ncbi:MULTISPECIES: RipA family octameric membrane protein [Catenuloplanes]|uniref:Small integral membrane protein n=1 Tax=Catenuloplanes niger TaxID=587534 RepID=A0AAE3ZYB4_9ACTN|nr:hypothetical protein [Catenuloplanes niger]MDR7328279.1 hypothetical protein [Catenuloplanes niger]